MKLTIDERSLPLRKGEGENTKELYRLGEISIFLNLLSMIQIYHFLILICWFGMKTCHKKLKAFLFGHWLTSHKALNSIVCIMCRRAEESITHLFIHCPSGYLYGRDWLGGLIYLCSHASQFLIHFWPFGFNEKDRSLCWCVALVVLWVVWLERKYNLRGKNQ